MSVVRLSPPLPGRANEEEGGREAANTRDTNNPAHRPRRSVGKPVQPDQAPQPNRASRAVAPHLAIGRGHEPVLLV